jgi:chemotaxis protein MotB
VALSRRTGARFQASIWPGFVDAMTGLLLVLMFVLTIFMVVQFVLTEQISGQETELDELSSEVAALAQALGLERRATADLESEAAQQSALIATLQAARVEQEEALGAAQTQITRFEAQVAGLIADRERALGQVADLEAREATLLTEQEALNAALAASRAETDAQSEQARLAAARREALEVLMADLRARNAQAQGQIETLSAQAQAAQEALSAQEAAQLAEAAAAQALRERLENADTELTAMTLSLEAQRRAAEETLTLLAAARAAQEELDLRLSAAQADGEAEIEDLRARLAAALAAQLAAENTAGETQTAAEQRAALLAQAQAQLAQEQETSAAAQRQTEILNQQVAALRLQLSNLQGLLDEAEVVDAAREVELQSLGSQLNTALARVAAEERRRAELEAAEVARLEAETKNLEQYRSEFFGRLRTVLGTQEGVRIEGDRFVFSSEVLFPPGGADLSREGRGEVAKVADILRNVAADIPEGIDWVIRVDGHTDNVPLSGQGEFADNWELSQARALSVVKYMADFLGIPPDRLAANGFGQYQPVDTANTDAARARNRRIELKFTEK